VILNKKEPNRLGSMPNKLHKSTCCDNMMFMSTKQPEKFYVYVHRREDDGRIFYIGKGTRYRAWHVGKMRSKYWNRIVSKHGRTVHIAVSGLTNAQAIAIEIDFIKHYGMENLCNMTDGGEGVSGRIHSEETKRKISLSNIGKLKPSIRGEKNHMHNPETKAKISAALKGRKAPWSAGIAKSQEVREKISKSKKGKPNPKIFGSNHFHSKKVVCVETGVVFGSGMDAVRWLKDNGFPLASSSYISRVCVGRLKTTCGYTWKFEQ